MIEGLKHGRYNLVGLNDSAKAWLIGDLAERAMVVVADEFIANTLLDNWQALSDRPCASLRPRNYNFSDSLASSHDLELQRAAALGAWLRGDLACLIVPVQCLSDRFPDPSSLERHIEVKLSHVIDPQELLRQLTQARYRPVRMIEAAGQFAHRGDVIDVGFIAEGEVRALRISFFDNEIDDLRYFSIDSQRSIESVTSCVIPLAGEFVLDDREFSELSECVEMQATKVAEQIIAEGGNLAAAENYRKLCLRDARLLRDHNYEALKRWLAQSEQFSSSILDFLGDAKLFLDEPAKLRYRADQAQADRSQQFKYALEKQQVTPAFQDTYLVFADIFRDLHSRANVALSELGESGNGIAGASKKLFAVQASDRYRQRELSLYADIQKFQNTGLEVKLFAGNKARQERLIGLLQAENITVDVSAANLRHGFIWQEAGIAYIGSEDIFGSQQRSRRLHQRGTSIELFSDLKRGEYVVHEQHGVGIYEGLATLETGGLQKDYLSIAYAGDDRLYIPVENLAQITKYIAPDGKKPKITKIGSSEWSKAKQRAQTSIRKLAVDLQTLYAERRRHNGFKFGADTAWQTEFETSFPYEPTPDQERAIVEIKQDMESDKVMDRLLCGDVGFGKTEIAFRAMFKAVMSGKQAAMLAPTTVLSRQHYENLQERIGSFPIRLCLLNRFVSATERKRLSTAIAKGEIDLVIGTHQLLAKNIQFKDLGLLVVDEEQRFGVNHKEKIKERYPQVDVLTMSATPIPRTLHMSLTGIRDISTLSAGPDNRRPIQTYVLPYESGIIDEAIIREAARGGQVFYLYNDTYKIASKCRELQERLPGARIVYAHGKMSRTELDTVIDNFIKNSADVLVCTTIIESGIDMPNVNTIIVENADKLGLAQLYQIRGRVGRSERQAYAYITYDGEKILNEDAAKRLSAIRDYTELGSGFKIAMRDLEVRGAGNLLGAEQHGHMESIGYDLYCRMLEDAVAELTGETKPDPLPETKLELNIDALIPDTYIDDEGQRMEAYHRINNLYSERDYSDILDELIDRYGEPPTKVISLLDIAYSGKQAQRVGIEQITENGDQLKLWLSERVQMQLLSSVFEAPEYRDKIVFNAGQKPCLTLKFVPGKPHKRAAYLRAFFRVIEQASSEARAADQP